MCNAEKESGIVEIEKEQECEQYGINDANCYPFGAAI